MKVTVKNMELTASRNDEPMVLITFTSEEGQDILFKQIITQKFQINMVNALLKDFDTETDIRFESYTQYNNLINQVFSQTCNRKYNLFINNFDDLHIYEVQAA